MNRMRNRARRFLDGMVAVGAIYLRIDSRNESPRCGSPPHPEEVQTRSLADLRILAALSGGQLPEPGFLLISRGMKSRKRESSPVFPKTNTSAWNKVPSCARFMIWSALRKETDPPRVSRAFTPTRAREVSAMGEN